MSSHPDTDRPEDRGAETHESITARLEGAKASQAQIRFTLGMMAVISMMMLIASYNAYFSYDYNWIIDGADCETAIEGAIPAIEIKRLEPRHAVGNPQLGTSSPSSSSPAASQSEQVAKTLKEQALKDWATSRIVLISLLGIRVSVDDASILGTSVLLILSVWLLLWARRENYTIGRLLHDTYDHEDPSITQTKHERKLYSNQERWLIFHTLHSSTIFLAIYRSSTSIKSLYKPLPGIKDESKVDRVWLRSLRNFFFLFPVIAAFMVLAIDTYSYFIPDPFNPFFECPWYEKQDRPFFLWSRCASGLFLLLLGFSCWRSKKYSTDTQEVFRQYEAKLEPAHSEPEQQPTN